MKKVALCLHDVSLSAEAASVALIESVSRLFRAPLTVHLIVDTAIRPASPLLSYLSTHVRQGTLEVVFHGLTHACPRGTWPHLAWYHRNQAEYAANDPAARERAREAYDRLALALGRRPGVCPPCWLWTQENRAFFVSLAPPYIESMLALEYRGRRVFSPIISIGSPRTRDLPTLETLARGMMALSRLLPQARVRVAVHPCDTACARSMAFLTAAYGTLLTRGAASVLLGQLR